MLRKRNEFRINAADTKPNIGIGLLLPFGGNSVFNVSYTTGDQIKANLINFVLTNRGERPFNPNFGGDLRRYLFEPFTTIDELESTLRNKIPQYIPQIIINEVKIIKNDEDNQILITIGYTVNNKPDTVVIALQ